MHLYRLTEVLRGREARLCKRQRKDAGHAWTGFPAKGDPELTLKDNRRSLVYSGSWGEPSR